MHISLIPGFNHSPGCANPDPRFDLLFPLCSALTDIFESAFPFY